MTGISQARSPLSFFVLAFVGSWTPWIGAALAGLSPQTTAGLTLYLLGGLGPPIAAVLLIVRGKSSQAWDDFWERLTQIRRIPLGWFALSAGLPAAMTVFAISLDVVLGGTGGQPEALAILLARPDRVLPFLLLTVLLGPLPEEIGWRGYALDRLQAVRTPLVASTILGAAWALWHLPLFFIADTYQANLGVLTSRFWQFHLSLLPLSVVYTWIYNHTNRSTLSAVLFHSAVNGTGELLATSLRAESILFCLWFLLAVFLALRGGLSSSTTPAPPQRPNRGLEETRPAGSP